MAHPARRAFVGEMAELLPEATVVWDRKNDRWDTGRRALLSHDPAARFHLVVQDDAILCRDFVAGAELVASVAGDRPVALYTGKTRPYAETITPVVRRAIRTRTPWLATRGPLWGVAIILPTKDIAEVVGWGDTHLTFPNYDRRIGTYYASRGIDCWYTIPSLVDHRPVAENPSLIYGRTGNRRAHRFIGDRSPLEMNWNRKPLRCALPEEPP